VTTLDPIMLGEHSSDDHALVFSGLPGDPPDGRRYLRNVTVPTLTPYLPEPASATGTGIVVVPGGALHFLSIDNEGAWVAQRLIERGIAAFVLHYRVVPTPTAEVEFAAASERAGTDRRYLADIGLTSRAPAVQDGGGAVQLVRQRAEQWRVDPHRVGMLGFSAGGFVTAVTAMDAEPGARPSFLAPIYPAIWGEIVVPSPAPPMFLAWATDDEGGDLIVGSALRLYDSWRRAGGSVEAHAYATGGHGFGMSSRGTASDRWFGDFCAWLEALGS
jgi:acetyl esterase/lipase